MREDQLGSAHSRTFVLPVTLEFDINNFSSPSFDPPGQLTALQVKDMSTYCEQLTTLKCLSSRLDSAVFLCRERTSNDLVVLKQSCLESLSSPRDDPRQEHAVAQLLASLGGHQYLLNCRAARIERGSLFLVMDFYEQGDLYTFLEAQAGSKLVEPLARRIFAQIAQGVGFLHQHGIAHRDISLENVLLDDKCAAKLCDFGLSAFFAIDKYGKRSASGCVGKGYYMAPEVIGVGTGEYDPVLADIWSLGIVFFIMLTGSPLFEMAAPQDPAFAAVQRIGVRGVLRHWEMEDKISSATINLLDRMLQLNPANRFQNVDELIFVMEFSTGPTVAALTSNWPCLL